MSIDRKVQRHQLFGLNRGRKQRFQGTAVCDRNEGWQVVASTQILSPVIDKPKESTTICISAKASLHMNDRNLGK